MSGRKDRAMEDCKKAFKYFLKEPVTQDSLKKYLLCTKKTDFLDDNYEKFEETLSSSEIKKQFQNMTYKLNAEVVEFDGNNERTDDVPAESRKGTKATGIAKNFAPQAFSTKFNKREPVRQRMEMLLTRDLIERDFKTAKEELQQQQQQQKNSLEIVENAGDFKDSDVEMRRQGSSNLVQGRDESVVAVNDGDFKSAKEELRVQKLKKHGSVNSVQPQLKRKLVGRRGVCGKFVSPVLSSSGDM